MRLKMRAPRMQRRAEVCGDITCLLQLCWLLVVSVMMCWYLTE